MYRKGESTSAHRERERGTEHKAMADGEMRRRRKAALFNEED
jgi:hypothetical protein